MAHATPQHKILNRCVHKAGLTLANKNQDMYDLISKAGLVLAYPRRGHIRHYDLINEIIPRASSTIVLCGWTSLPWLLYKSEFYFRGATKLVSMAGPAPFGKESKKHLVCSSFGTWQCFKHGKKGFHYEQRTLGVIDASVAAAIIRDFSNPGELVIDLWAGEGAFGIGCAHEGRSYLGFSEKNSEFTVACERVREAYAGRFNSRDAIDLTNHSPVRESVARGATDNETQILLSQLEDLDV
jgi:hypothetical protein